MKYYKLKQPNKEYTIILQERGAGEMQYKIDRLLKKYGDKLYHAPIGSIVSLIRYEKPIDELCTKNYCYAQVIKLNDIYICHSIPKVGKPIDDEVLADLECISEEYSYQSQYHTEQDERNLNEKLLQELYEKIKSEVE